MSMYMATNVYGGRTAPAPVSNAAPDDTPSDAIRMTKTPFAGGLNAHNPTLALILLFALAIYLIHFSVGFDFGFKVKH